MAKSKSQKRLEARDRAAEHLTRAIRNVEQAREEIATLERSLAARPNGTTFTDNFLGFTDRDLLASKQRSLGYLVGRRESAWTELKKLNRLCGLNEFERDRHSPILVIGEGRNHEA